MTVKPVRISPSIIVTFLTLISAILVVIDIQRPSYWIDENVSVVIASPPNPLQVVNNVIEGERRPPGYHLFLWVWTRLTGVSERMARLHSALWSIILVPITYQLARRFTKRKSALLAAAFAAVAPIMISYGQTIRYYTMVASISALSYTLFIDVIHKPKAKKPWGAYFIVTLILLYLDYPAYGVLIAQNILALWEWFNKRSAPSNHPRWGWVGVQAILLLSVGLWIPVVINQSGRDFGAADLSYTLVGGLLRIAYPFYAWIVGETVFPWSIPGLIGAVIGGFLLMYGVIQLQTHKRWMWIVAFVIPFAMSQALLSTIAADSPFVNAPARSMACAALVFVGLGIGIGSIRRNSLLGVILVGLLISHFVALQHYYRGVEFINTIYNTPAREVAMRITSEAKSGDIVITESDSMVDLYLPQEIASFHPDETGKIARYLQDHPRVGIWQVVMGRDRTRNNISADLRQWLSSFESLRSVQGFAEQDAVYRALKSRLIGREAYQYRLSLYYYQSK
ncbi:MAG: glycosyltransferase family 39 protein [Chloroflexi bacterium]|nr:glycosyltransferase family 39 protein [Chloroflexota bacterium]MCL5274155.1 glycosyltransferase family 39 protein [Chloroflexota bacterium]